MELKSIPNPLKCKPKTDTKINRKFKRTKINGNGALERSKAPKVALGGRRGVPGEAWVPSSGLACALSIKKAMDKRQMVEDLTRHGPLALRI